MKKQNDPAKTKHFRIYKENKPKNMADWSDYKIMDIYYKRLKLIIDSKIVIM